MPNLMLAERCLHLAHVSRGAIAGVRYPAGGRALTSFAEDKLQLLILDPRSRSLPV